MDVEPKGDAGLNIHEDVFVITYLQMGEVPMGLKLSNMTMFYICPNSLSGRIILFINVDDWMNTNCVPL